MPFTCYVSVEGTKQGKFKGEQSFSKLGKDKVTVVRFASGVVSPRDVATGQASGKRRYEPIEFTKELGGSSPQFLQALTSNEVLKTVLFEFVRTNASGAEEVHYTIKLTNASVASSRISLDLTERGHPLAAHELHTITLAFEKIEQEDKSAKTTTVDDFNPGG